MLKKLLLSLFFAASLSGAALANTATLLGVVSAGSGADITTGSAGTGACDEGLGVVEPSVVADFDFSCAESYPGSGQEVANIEPSPADSSTASDHVLYFGDDGGSAADDPTFTGTAGVAGSYALLDGTDYLTAKNPTTTFVNSLHKTSTSGWWVAIVFYLPAGQPANVGLFGSSWVSMDHGWYPWLVGASSTAKSSTIWRSYGSGLDNQTLHAGVLAEATKIVYIISGDNTTGTNNLKYWYRSTTAGATISKSWTADTTNLNGGWRVGSTDANGSNQGIMKNGSRIYAISYGNVFADNTVAANIIGGYESRWSEDLTP